MYTLMASDNPHESADKIAYKLVQGTCLDPLMYE